MYYVYDHVERGRSVIIHFHNGGNALEKIELSPTHLIHSIPKKNSMVLSGKTVDEHLVRYQASKQIAAGKIEVGDSVFVMTDKGYLPLNSCCNIN